MASVIHLFSAYDSGKDLTSRLPTRFTWMYLGADTINYFHLQGLLSETHPLASQPEDFATFVLGLRDEFVTEMESVNDAFGSSIDYWVDDLFSKNPHSEDMFFSYCQLRFIEDVINHENNGDVVLFLEDRDLAMIVQKRLPRKIGLGFKVSPLGWRKGARKEHSVMSYVKFVVSSLLMLLYARFWQPPPEGKRSRREMDVLVETYAKPDDFSNGDGFQDRYLPGLFAFLSKKGFKVGVAPVLCGAGLRAFKEVLSRIRGESYGSIIVKEDYLKIRDYLWAAMHPLRRIGLADLRSCIKDGILKDVLLAAHNKTRFSAMAYESLLRYRFTTRLYEAGCEVRRVVMWYENQALHKAFCSGMRRHYPSVPIVGAQMFIPPINQMNLYTTASEGRANILPNYFLVPGPAFASIFAQYNPSARFEVAASMRYGHMTEADITPLPLSPVPQIAVLLPQSLLISLNVLKVLFMTLGEEISHLIIAIKPHPTVPAEYCRHFMKERGVNVSPESFVSGSSRQLVAKSDVVISAASGSILESICMGRPVIEIGLSTGLELAPYMVPEASILYRKAYEIGAVHNALFDWALGSVRELTALQIAEASKRVMNRCFTPVEEETMMPFIGAYY